MCIAGGDSKTLMFVQISPSDQDSGETLSSLNFASRVRGIELGPAKRQIDTSELQKVKAMVGLVNSTFVQLKFKYPFPYSFFFLFLILFIYLLFFIIAVMIKFDF
jgi:hypothetical protein